MADGTASQARPATGNNGSSLERSPHTYGRTDSIASTQPVSHTRLPSERRSAQRSDRVVLDIGVALIEDIIKQKADVDHGGTTLSSQRHSQLVQDLLRKSEPESQQPPQGEAIPTLPTREVAVELVASAFDKCFLLSEIVPKEHFQDAGMRLYNLEATNYTAAEHEFLPLFYVVIGLAHVVSWSMHNELGCEKAVAEGIFYFRAAENLSSLRDIASVTQLRVLLCMIIFQMTTSDPHATRRFLTLARTATVKLGLYAQHAFQPRVQDMEDTPGQNLLWTVTYLDIYICGLLGSPSLAETSGTESATLSALRHAAQNVSRLVRSSQRLLLNVALALHIELFKILRAIQVIVRHEAAIENQADQSVMDDGHFLEIERLRQELVDWDVVMTNIFPRDEAVHVVARARFELRMSHYLARIMLHYQYMKHHAESPGGVEDPVTLRRIQYGRTCVETSRAAVTAAKEYSKVPAISPFSWPSAYVLFVSTITLFVALTRAEGAEQQQIKDSIMLSVLLMRQMACVAYAGTTSYLNLIEEMAIETSSLVDWQASGQASDPTSGNSYIMPFMDARLMFPLDAWHGFNLDFLNLPET